MAQCQRSCDAASVLESYSPNGGRFQTSICVDGKAATIGEECRVRIPRSLNLNPALKIDNSFGSIEEVIATAELGCHSATISPRVIDELARTPYDASKDTSGEKTRQKSSRNITDPIPERLLHLLAADPLATGDFIAARIDIDYLADNGAELEAALGHDPVGRSRLKDALAWFERAENSSKAFILEKSKITTV